MDKVPQTSDPQPTSTRGAANGASGVASPTGVLRALADETRLRLLALLARAELSVGELARCLAMGQSRVSNHLKVLRELDLIGERRDGSLHYCRLELPAGLVKQLWPALEPTLQGLERGEADRRRLAAVLSDRHDSREFFDRIAGDWDVIGADFSRGTGRLEALGCLVPSDLVVADVGCGTGYLSQALARQVSRVICIDSSTAMLDQARENLLDATAELDFREGRLEALPLADAEVDAACAHMVLHHLADLRAGMLELARVTRPGGDVVCVDLLPHNEVWMRESMADRALGLEPGDVVAAFQAAGLEGVSKRVLGDSYVVEQPNGRNIELPLFLISGRKPA